MTASICQENMHIWSFDCVMICSALGLALESRKIKKLCHKYGLIPRDKKVDPAFGYYQLHRACHQERGILPVKLEKSLNARFFQVVEQVRAFDEHDAAALTGLVEKAMQEAPAGILWALLTDPRDDVRHHGVYLAHRIMLTALHDYNEEKSETQSVVIAPEPDSLLRSQLEQAEKKANKFREEAERLKKALAKAQERIAGLEKEHDIRSKRMMELEVRPSVEGRLRRELRKVRYELEQRKEQLIKEPQPRRSEIGGPALSGINLLATRFAWPRRRRGQRSEVSDHERTTAMIDTAKRNDPVCEQEDCRRQGSASCPLEALKVAVVGGLDRLQPHYRKVVEDMGARFLFHNGICQGGTYTLKNVVCGSDIVVFITSINSHSALKAVKVVCRRTGKRFVTMRETSPIMLERTLREAVA